MGDLRLGEAWGTGQRFRNDLIYVAARLSISGALLAPRALLPCFGRHLGRVAAAILPAYRSRCRTRLYAAFDNRPPVRTMQVFEALGADLADSLMLFDKRERVDRTLDLSPEAEQVLRRVSARGRGVVFATAHLGPMDRMAALIATRGFPVLSVARESYDPRLTRLVEQVRCARGVYTIYRGRPGTGLAVRESLHNGCVVGFPMDLGGRGIVGIRSRFLGETCEIPIGPARIALGARAPVVVGTPQPSPHGGHWVTVEEVEVPSRSARDADEGLTLQIAEVLEQRIRRMPEHWPWMHLSAQQAASLPLAQNCSKRSVEPIRDAPQAPRS